MNPWRGLGSLPREVWVLSTVTLINRAGTMVLPFLVLYLTKSLNLSPQQAGLVLLFYGVGSLVTAPIAGKLCDRVGSLRVMKTSLFLSGLTLFAFPLAHSFVTVSAITILWAIINEAFRPASMSIISEAVSTDQRKAAFSLNRLAINLGMSIGPVVGGFLAEASFLGLFIVDGVTSILAGVVLAATRWPETSPEIKPHAQAGAPAKQLSVLADRRLLWFLAVMIPVVIIFFQTQGAMPLFVVRDLHFSESLYGLLLTINTVLIILIEVPLNMAMARWSHKRAVALGALLTGAGFGALAFASNGWTIAVTVFIWTFGEMIIFPSSAAFVADIAPPERRGVYSGLYVMSFSVAFLIGPWVGIAILERFGATALWSGAFVCGLISAAMILAMKTFDVKETPAAEM
ncbi:MAG: MFS transporter [Blastocatellia bacterium]